MGGSERLSPGGAAPSCGSLSGRREPGPGPLLLLRRGGVATALVGGGGGGGATENAAPAAAATTAPRPYSALATAVASASAAAKRSSKLAGAAAVRAEAIAEPVRERLLRPGSEQYGWPFAFAQASVKARHWSALQRKVCVCVCVRVRACVFFLGGRGTGGMVRCHVEKVTLTKIQAVEKKTMT